MRPEDKACAVWGCAEQGKRHMCPFDGEHHSHGRVHYQVSKLGLKFRQGWHMLCDDHFKSVLQHALLSHPQTARVVQAVLMKGY